MPFFISIPLPGPFGWGKRIGGNKRKRPSAPLSEAVRLEPLREQWRRDAAAIDEVGERLDAKLDAWTERKDRDMERWEASQREKQAATKARLDAWSERMRAGAADRDADGVAQVEAWSERQDAKVDAAQARLDGWFERQQAKIDAKKAARKARRS